MTGHPWVSTEPPLGTSQSPGYIDSDSAVSFFLYKKVNIDRFFNGFACFYPIFSPETLYFPESEEI